MEKKDKRNGDTADLRKRAEEKIRADDAKTRKKLTAEETRKMLHELRVHQIELEMQNEELRRAQAELDAARTRYFDLYDLAPVGYCTVSEQGLILEANLTAAKLFGWERKQLVKQPLTSFILNEDQDVYYRLRKQLFESGAPQVCELRMLNKEGNHFWVRLHASSVQDATGPAVSRVVMSDISERKRVESQREAALEALQKSHDELDSQVQERTAELAQANEMLQADIIESMRAELQIKAALEALRRSEENFRRLLDDLPLGVSVVTAAGETIYANRQLLDIYGYDNVEELNKISLKERYTPQSHAEFELRRKARDRGEFGPTEYEIAIVRKNGEVRCFQVFCKAILWNGANQFQALYREITERKWAESQREAALKEIRRKAKELREKNEELERFTYSVSHDLKSPLVTILTFLGHLEQDMTGMNKEQVKQDLGYIRIGAEKMSRLLDELLALSQVGRKINPPEEVPLQTIVKEASGLVAGRITERGVEVKVTKAEFVLWGDRVRLVEVFQNLLDNACKFMGEQKSPLVEIGVETKDGEAVIFVRDNGIGITSQFLPKLFIMFEKLNRSTEGDGIGLALVKRIVEVHGGRIWVESEGPGQGTTFYFTLGKTCLQKTKENQ